MKRVSISSNVIRRMPRYFRALEELMGRGVERISSVELGHQLGLNPSQVRQDLSRFGEFGVQGYGYNVGVLRDEVASILGVGSGFSVVVIGLGNLGHALLKNFRFSRYGYRVIAAFDVNPDIVGTTTCGVPVYEAGMFSAFAAENPVDIAVLTVPPGFALSTARSITTAGVRAIWNFTNVELNHLGADTLVEDIHFSDSLFNLSYYLSEQERRNSLYHSDF